ncbi:hypothetical protein Droror1_Dr00018336 [Drosera rotundifolia]
MARFGPSRKPKQQAATDQLVSNNRYFKRMLEFDERDFKHSWKETWETEMKSVVGRALESRSRQRLNVEKFK